HWGLSRNRIRVAADRYQVPATASTLPPTDRTARGRKSTRMLAVQVVLPEQRRAGDVVVLLHARAPVLQGDAEEIPAVGVAHPAVEIGEDRGLLGPRQALAMGVAGDERGVVHVLRGRLHLPKGRIAAVRLLPEVARRIGGVDAVGAEHDAAAEAACRV